MNADRSSYLKQKRKNANRTLEEDRLAQLDMFRDDDESRIVQEDLLCQRTDVLVAKMEKEETEPLNEQLQNAGASRRRASASENSCRMCVN